jgi:YggT family protein
VFVIGNLLSAIATLLDFVLNGLLIVLFVNAILSWVRPDPSNPIVSLLDRISDTVCAPVRRLFPTVYSGVDFAPFVTMLGLWFIQMFLVRTLQDMAMRM